MMRIFMLWFIIGVVCLTGCLLVSEIFLGNDLQSIFIRCVIDFVWGFFLGTIGILLSITLE